LETAFWGRTGMKQCLKCSFPIEDKQAKFVQKTIKANCEILSKYINTQRKKNAELVYV
jgi:hypothetical protein